MDDRENPGEVREQPGGHLIVDCLRAQGVERVFCVPGESYLAVLDGLYDSGIDVINARHEGGAAMMAEADGKMTGRPGVALVTRGPGATNASSGVHIAQQDSTPMILLAGQIGRDMRGRDAFQEVDCRQMFRGLAKWVEEIDRVDRIPEVMNHAWHVAMSGRPGPVVLALPEDVLRDRSGRTAGPHVSVADPAPTAMDMKAVTDLLNKSEKPFMIIGGSRWPVDSVRRIREIAEKWVIPVGCSFRRQGLFGADHAQYAGDVGLGINPKLKERIADSDLILLLGGRFSENPSQSFSLFMIPEPKQKLVHVHPGAEELGRIYTPDLAINATPEAFLRAADGLVLNRQWPEVAAAARHDYLAWTETLPEGVGALTMSHVIGHMRRTISDDAILTNGAGNYAIWPNRYFRYRVGTLLAPTSGSMGYGLPAAIAAGLRFESREIFCFAGDGCFQMSAMEFAVAAEHGLKVRVLVCDNGIYGTIRMHQERDYPRRRVATDIDNPDFTLWARSYGAFAERVETAQDFPAAFGRMCAAEGPSLLHLILDPRDIAPGWTLGHNREARKLA